MINEEPTLNTLFSDLNKIDIFEPACMDLVISFFEELTENSEDYMQLLADQLKNAVITWRQPWYQVSHRLTRPFRETRDQNEEQYCSGTMTTEEKRQIRKNWQMFLEEFQVPDKMRYLAMWKNRENHHFTPKERARGFIFAYLARGLQRNLHQVYRYVVSHYEGINSGNLTQDEIRVLEICFTHCPKNAAVYASTVLARESRIIYIRLHQSINGKRPNCRTKWTLPLATKFVKCLMEYSGKSFEGLKNKTFDVGVWTKLAEEFNKPKEYLRLQSSSFERWPDIRWLQVLSKFPDGFTHFMLYNTAVRTARKYPNYCNIPLSDIVEFSLQRVRAGKNGPYKTKRLKTLTLNKDGNLEEIRYDDRLVVKFFK